jgi:hypothetical protein
MQILKLWTMTKNLQRILDDNFVSYLLTLTYNLLSNKTPNLTQITKEYE